MSQDNFQTNSSNLDNNLNNEDTCTDLTDDNNTEAINTEDTPTSARVDSPPKAKRKSRPPRRHKPDEDLSEEPLDIGSLGVEDEGDDGEDDENAEGFVNKAQNKLLPSSSRTGVYDMGTWGESFLRPGSYPWGIFPKKQGKNKVYHLQKIAKKALFLLNFRNFLGISV